MVPHTVKERTVSGNAVAPSREDINAIVEANRVLEATPEIRGTQHALSIISTLRYENEWSKGDLLVAQPALAAYRTIANLESSQEYWIRELSFPDGGDYPYELVEATMSERLHQAVILNHAHTTTTELLELFN